MLSKGTPEMRLISFRFVLTFSINGLEILSAAEKDKRPLKNDFLTVLSKLFNSLILILNSLLVDIFKKRINKNR